MSVKFQAGSIMYNQEFARSIARFLGSPDGASWLEPQHLINVETLYKSADEAALLAKLDIDHAHKQAKAEQSAYTVDHILASKGYQTLDVG